MSIELIDKIKPKNNGTFSLVDACDVEMEDGRRLEDAVKTHTSSSIPENGVLEVGVLYFLGEVEEINIGLPDTANLGDTVYLSFMSGTSPTVLNITTDNHAGIDELIIQPEFTYEIMGMWNGSKWVMVKHEVM